MCDVCVCVCVCVCACVRACVCVYVLPLNVKNVQNIEAFSIWTGFDLSNKFIKVKGQFTQHNIRYI